ncbi:MAG: TadA family conjugal transfer-associated ATPase [Nocardioidaceae bacterium]
MTPALDVDALVESARAQLAAWGAELTAPEVARALRAQGGPVGDALVLDIYDRLSRELHGAGSLDEVLALDGVTDVLVNSTDGVYIDRGQGLELTSLTFADDRAVRRLAQRLATSASRRLDDASPYVDARLPNGTRLHAVLAGVARPGTVISLRVPGRRAFTLADLEARGMFDADVRRLLERVVAARAAYLISGGTGSGKTTLLSAMLTGVPAGERIVIVEDSTELRPDHRHVVGLEARPPNIEGVGRITVQDLVRQALRMRPDRLVVGEVRGAEIRDLLAALNTGHEGGCGTIHANSAADVPARIEALATAAGLSRESAHSQLMSAVDLVLHLGRDGSRRCLAEIAALRRIDGLVETEPALLVGSSGEVREGPAVGALERLLR